MRVYQFIQIMFIFNFSLSILTTTGFLDNFVTVQRDDEFFEMYTQFEDYSYSQTSANFKDFTLYGDLISTLSLVSETAIYSIFYPAAILRPYPSVSWLGQYMTALMWILLGYSLIQFISNRDFGGIE